MPGWTAYIDDTPIDQVVYNTRPLDAAEVSLQGVASDSLTPIQGDYTVELFGASRFAPQQSAAIGQTGQIPASARSLLFWGYSTDVSFGGHALSLSVLDITPNYYIYGADISAFAGQTGELRFTVPPQSLSVIDNIQFSDQRVPEPGAFAVSVLGASVLGWRVWRRRR